MANSLLAAGALTAGAVVGRLALGQQITPGVLLVGGGYLLGALITAWMRRRRLAP